MRLLPLARRIRIQAFEGCGRSQVQFDPLRQRFLTILLEEELPAPRDRRLLKWLVESDCTSLTDQPASQRSASAREVKNGPPSVSASSGGPLAGFTRIAMGESGRADASAVLSARTSVNTLGA